MPGKEHLGEGTIKAMPWHLLCFTLHKLGQFSGPSVK
jgi:hypothetical protein